MCIRDSAYKGLLSIDPQRAIKVLTTEADGLPFAFTDDLDIASDGTIYFSDASSRFQQPDYLLDLLEARPHGRLLAYDPASGETRVLLDGLYLSLIHIFPPANRLSTRRPLVVPGRRVRDG